MSSPSRNKLRRRRLSARWAWLLSRDDELQPAGRQARQAGIGEEGIPAGGAEAQQKDAGLAYTTSIRLGGDLCSVTTGEIY